MDFVGKKIKEIVPSIAVKRRWVRSVIKKQYKGKEPIEHSKNRFKAFKKRHPNPKSQHGPKQKPKCKPSPLHQMMLAADESTYADAGVEAEKKKPERKQALLSFLHAQ